MAELTASSGAASGDHLFEYLKDTAHELSELGERWIDVRRRVTAKVAAPHVCPQLIVPLPDRNSVMLLSESEVQVLLLATDASLGCVLVLPQPTVKPDYFPAKPVTAGYLRDDTLAVVLGSMSKADASEEYLYGYDEHQWVLEEEKTCNYGPCSFAELDRRPNDAAFWGDEFNIWHVFLDR